MEVCNIHKPLVGLHKDQPTELSCVCFVHSIICFVCHTFYFKYNRVQFLQKIVDRKTGRYDFNESHETTKKFNKAKVRETMT